MTAPSQPSEPPGPTGAGAADVVVITGGGRGIGAATARRLARSATEAGRPMHLVLNYVNDRAAAEAVATDIRANHAGAEATAIRADVASPDDVADLFATVDEIGVLSGLVNNAAVLHPIGSFTDIEPERMARTWSVNITGSFLCAQEAVRRMATDRGGTGGAIVNVSSRAAEFGSPNEFIDYAASKGALDSMTKGLATEVARHGIRVNAVRPGLIETDIHAAAGRPDRVEALAPNVPLGRGGTADEVANLITWLLSPEASYVTGALIDVGGGR